MSLKKILIAGRKTSGNETERQEKNTLMRSGKVCEWRIRPQEHRYCTKYKRTEHVADGDRYTNRQQLWELKDNRKHNFYSIRY